MITIALINATTVQTDKQLQPLASALEIQGQRDLLQAWPHIEKPSILFVPKGDKPPAGSWWLVGLDSSDQAGALGYHDLTDEGLPIGKFFAGTDLQYGSSISVTASHEFCEMLVDPNCTSIKQVQGGEVALEVCDACEDDQFAYDIDGIMMSDFVTPAFFDDTHPYRQGIQRFDYCGRIVQPMQILEGGYLSMNYGNGWTQVTHQNVPIGRRPPPVGSRRERRTRGHNLWHPSAP